ncbi:BirA family biotin operon repressor/biotin-[acetyl-CoA-carboxylase] ligase [Sphingobium fontiphilum]|uniref:BirA family biotin operon repressor/biotin-[acetyl-CoA-carboxylase] ligase n=1 Tax=Sphingobium fontiphilum TaxID=944425 RepID=A0A7W6GN64_9SPHN|nr:endonuclease domain-containing protein [Sphingobium fontiphilum]MBB3980988.1 BirA family biotin operon repressor/biotin-[acetyl-CoA-carboxylase] ligase [Sphingobium fontiphilum]
MVEKRLTSVARKLRRDPTEAEKMLWARLRAGQVDGFKFVRQFPIGPHVADFACRSAKLVVELDGGQHAMSEADTARTKLIEAHGYHVIRFWNYDVLSNIDGVLETIVSELRLARNLLP